MLLVFLEFLSPLTLCTDKIHKYWLANYLASLAWWLNIYPKTKFIIKFLNREFVTDFKKWITNMEAKGNTFFLSFDRLTHIINLNIWL